MAGAGSPDSGTGELRFPVAGGEVSGEVGGEVGTGTVKLDASKLNALLDFCSEARSRMEMQEFCGIKSQDYLKLSQ